jgi:hypothetical protein
VAGIKVYRQSWVTQSGMSLSESITMDDKLIFEKRWTR